MEEKHNDDTSSKSNQHEAELCVRLCRYLLQQGYPPDTLTILTAYSGQVFTFRNIMNEEQTFYQGEFSFPLKPVGRTQMTMSKSCVKNIVYTADTCAHNGGSIISFLTGSVKSRRK